jgi:Protein of unknown function (Hypoth_ymh)
MNQPIRDMLYAELKIIRNAIPFSEVDLHYSFFEDYHRILKNLKTISIGIYDDLDLGENVINGNRGFTHSVNRYAFISKLNQLITRMELRHGCILDPVNILHISILDNQLKSRCEDLMSAEDHFDRVINQATQVLEERVREKVPSLKYMTGMPLVAKAINPEPLKSMIVFSNNPSEQEGYANLFKGLMGTFRNQSHHKFLETVTREQALQICAFIDNMLAALEGAEVKSA